MYRLVVYGLIVVWLLAGVAEAAPQAAEAEISPRQLIESAYEAATSLQSYTCKLTSVTRHQGANGRYQKGKKNVLNYTYRNPGQVRLEWLSPRRKRGQLAVYSDDTLRAAPSWLPFAVTVDPDSPTGMDDFHHPIYRSDLASLMEIVMQDMAKVTDEAYEGLITRGGRTGHKVVLQTEDKRVVIIIDSANYLPLVIEQYDKETGVLFDGGYFDNIKVDPQIDDSLFEL